MATKRKTTTAIVAGATALALLLGGTFAWTSISQQAKNETAGIVNVGGRLHDDFDGTNKDVYVENFTDPLNGGQPIYARIKLTEYMEVGQDAGGFGADVNDDGKVSAVPVISGTKIDDVTTWTPHVPDTSCAGCATEGTCVIHDHWKWTMGGDNGTTGSTIFMPTFNKDKDSLAADINGTYAGTNADDKIYYDDYVVYTTDNTADGVGVAIAEDAKEAYDGMIYSIIGTEYYDDDTNTADDGGTRQVAGVTHIAKETGTATVMTMQEWIDAGSLPGNYWVYDEDGWAYWANPIMPGEATGLLLDGIEMTSNPGEKCYYAINVVAQFATVGDWEYFHDEDETEFDGTGNAKTLLETVSQNVATVTVTNVSGATLLEPGESYEFSANVTVNGGQVLAASDFEWSVLNADLTENTKSTVTISDDGKAMLNVAENETSRNLIIVAKATAPNYLGALGMTSVAIDIPAPMYTLTDAGEIKAENTTIEGGTIRYEMANDANEVISIKLNRNIVGDVDSILADEDTVISGVNYENEPVEYATLELVDDETEDTLNITLAGVKITDTITVDGIDRPAIRLAITTEYDERIIVELLVKLTEDTQLQLTINGTAVDTDITINEDD